MTAGCGTVVVQTVPRPHPFSSFSGPDVRKHVRTFETPRPTRERWFGSTGLSRPNVHGHVRAIRICGPRTRAAAQHVSSSPTGHAYGRMPRRPRARCFALHVDGPTRVPSPPSITRRCPHCFSESPTPPRRPADGATTPFHRHDSTPGAACRTLRRDSHSSPRWDGFRRVRMRRSASGWTLLAPVGSARTR